MQRLSQGAARPQTVLAEFGVTLAQFVLVCGRGRLRWIVDLALVFYLDSEARKVVIWTCNAINLHTCQLHLSIGDLGCNLSQHGLFADDVRWCICHGC